LFGLEQGDIPRDKEIAAKLALTSGTIKVYLARLYDKLRVQNRLGAAIWAQKNKDLLTFDDTILTGDFQHV